jgi:hypothetical protein
LADIEKAGIDIKVYSSNTTQGLFIVSNKVGLKQAEDEFSE